jgi:hypothetical protein
MSNKPNRLQDALKGKAQGVKPEANPDPAPEGKTESKENSRTGKVMISAYMPKEVRASFRLIQAKHPEKQIQDLMAEAFNDLFAKYNVPQTAMLD